MGFFTRSTIAALLMAAAVVPAAAQAQEPRITLSFTPAFATVGGDTAAAVSGSLGYRFTDHVSFEGDFTWIDAATGVYGPFALGTGDFSSGVSNLLPRGVGVGRSGNNARLPFVSVGNLAPAILRTIDTSTFLASPDGRTMIGTFGLRYEPTVQTARFRPYVAAGLGLNHTEQDFNLSVATIANSFDDSISHSGFAFSAGGGASIRLFSSLWANADAKYFRLSGDRDIMRLGGGVAVRF